MGKWLKPIYQIRIDNIADLYLDIYKKISNSIAEATDQIIAAIIASAWISELSIIVLRISSKLYRKKLIKS